MDIERASKSLQRVRAEEGRYCLVHTRVKRPLLCAREAIAHENEVQLFGRIAAIQECRRTLDNAAISECRRCRPECKDQDQGYETKGPS